MDGIARLEAGGLPDSALDAIPVLLAGERLAEAAPVAIVGRPRLDAENERRLAVEDARQVDFDRRPSVAMNGDRDVVDQDDGLVEHAFHDEDDAPARPVGRHLERATVPSDPLGVA